MTQQQSLLFADEQASVAYGLSSAASQDIAQIRGWLAGGDRLKVLRRLMHPRTPDVLVFQYVYQHVDEPLPRWLLRTALECCETEVGLQSALASIYKQHGVAVWVDDCILDRIGVAVNSWKSLSKLQRTTNTWDWNGVYGDKLIDRLELQLNELRHHSAPPPRWLECWRTIERGDA